MQVRTVSSLGQVMVDVKGRVVIPWQFRSRIGDPFRIIHFREGILQGIREADWTVALGKRYPVHARVSIAANGRIQIPISMRRHCSLRPGMELMVWMDAGKLWLAPYEAWLEWLEKPE